MLEVINKIKIKVKGKDKHVDRKFHLLDPSVEETIASIEEAKEAKQPQVFVYTNNKYFMDKLRAA